jgi:NAD(P)-dependent dehydrogenase (short-subunit alcohol dehydrogenase family)
MTNVLNGKYAVITGGTQGLGETTTRLFAERGASGLVICGRNSDRGHAIAKEITAIGCPTHFVQADLSRVDDCRAVIRKADETFGIIHTLVNAAGITDRGTLLDTSPDLFDRIIAVNVRAPFFLMQEAVRIMLREHIHGTIVNILSMSANGGEPFLSVYSGSKGALATLTKNAAYALLRDQIRINGLNIGWLDTPGEDRTQKLNGAGDNWLVEAESRQPFGRLLKSDEVAKVIAFLSCEESGMLTGAIIDFDQSVTGCHNSPPHPPLPGEPQ